MLGPDGLAAEMGFGFPVRNRVSTTRNFNDLRPTDLCWRENARLVRSITNATAAHIKCGGFWGARQLPGVSQTCSRVFRISASDPTRDIDQGSSVGLSAGDLLAEFRDAKAQDVHRGDQRD